MNRSWIAFFVWITVASTEFPYPAGEVKTRIGLDIPPNIPPSKDKYVFLVTGELAGTIVGYPVVLINPNTLVSYLVDDLVNPTVCDEQICTPPDIVSTHENYTFWTVKLGIRKDKIRFYEGDITKASCKLNGVEKDVDFVKVEGSDFKYICKSNCREHDVVICNEAVAGILEKVDDTDTFILHDIDDILIAGGFSVKNERIGAIKTSKAKDVVMKVRVKESGSEVNYPAALINANTVVTYATNAIDKAQICDAINCTSADKVETRGKFTFWTADRLGKKPPKFYKGDITLASCNINRSNRKNEFRKIKPRYFEYTCSGKCTESDVLTCDNKIAGFLSRGKRKDTFMFNHIDSVLKITSQSHWRSSEAIEEIRRVLYNVKLKMNGRDAAILAVQISDDTLVSYLVEGATVENAQICQRNNCEPPKDVTSKTKYTFWTLKNPILKNKNAFRIFNGDIARAECKLNLDDRTTVLKQAPTLKPVYVCSKECRQSDVVVCNGKTAGLIAETDEKGEYDFHDINDVLKSGGYRIGGKEGAVKKVAGSRKVKKPKLNPDEGWQSGSGSGENPEEAEEEDEDGSSGSGEESGDEEVNDDDEEDLNEDRPSSGYDEEESGEGSASGDYTTIYEPTLPDGNGNEAVTSENVHGISTESKGTGEYLSTTSLITSENQENNTNAEELNKQTTLAQNKNTGSEEVATTKQDMVETTTEASATKQENETTKTETTAKKQEEETTISTTSEPKASQSTTKGLETTSITTKDEVNSTTESSSTDPAQTDQSGALTEESSGDVTSGEAPAVAAPPDPDLPYIKTGSENDTEKHIPATLIKAGMLVSSKLNDSKGATVCLNSSCIEPKEIKTVKEYTFWTIKDDKQVVPEFFRGSLDTANCSRNGNDTLVEFVPVMEDVYGCKPACELSDVIFCDGKVAGIIVERRLKNVGSLGKIDDILKLVSDVNVTGDVSDNPSLNDAVDPPAEAETRVSTPKTEDGSLFVRKSSDSPSIFPVNMSVVSVIFLVVLVSA